MKNLILIALLLLSLPCVNAKDVTVKVKIDEIKFDRPNTVRILSNGGRDSAKDAFLNRYYEANSNIYYEERRNDEENGYYNIIVSSDVIDSLRFSSPQPQYFLVPFKCQSQRNITRQIRKEITRLKVVERGQRNLCLNLDLVRKNLGKNITDSMQRLVIEVITDTLQNEKLKKEILKDLNRDKISKKISKPLEYVYAINYAEYMFAKENLEVLTSNNVANQRAMFYALKENPDYSSYYKKNKRWIPYYGTKTKLEYDRYQEKYREDFEDVVLYDTIPNIFLSKEMSVIPCNIHAYNSALLNRHSQIWNWIFDEEGTEVSESYPNKVSYLKYNSHPQYKIIKSEYDNWADVYDEKGNLIAVIINDPSDFSLGENYLETSSFIGKEIKKHEYNNNKYDIQKASASAKSYVTDQLGLRKKTAAEKKAQDKAASQIANAFIQHSTADRRYGANTRAAQRQKNKAAASFLGALIGASNYDSKGSAWITQIENDWKKKMGSFYSVDIINDNTYSVDYFGNDGEKLFNVTYIYSGSEPFKSKCDKTIKFYK